MMWTVLAGLAGLALGSFLNTCASRWPEGEKVSTPRSHCRSCGRTLTWWENVPLVSWLALGGRCRTCRAWIGWRYPLAELAVGVLWAYCVCQIFIAAPELSFGVLSYGASQALADGIARMIFLWLLVALAVFDAENLWLPDALILPGIGLGLVLALTRATLTAFGQYGGSFGVWKHLVAPSVVLFWFVGAVFAAGVLLVIRWIYQMIRGQEGIGFGDVKLMAMLGGWIGLKGAMLSFAIAVVLGAIVALLLLSIPSLRAGGGKWGMKKLPFGTFLCVGGIVGGLWVRTHPRSLYALARDLRCLRESAAGPQRRRRRVALSARRWCFSRRAGWLQSSFAVQAASGTCSRVRLKASVAKVNSLPTRSMPRCEIGAFHVVVSGLR